MSVIRSQGHMAKVDLELMWLKKSCLLWEMERNRFCSSLTFTENFWYLILLSSDQGSKRGCCCSVAKLCPTLCDPMDCNTLGSCPSVFSRMCSDSCPLSQRCYLTISSSATPFSFCLQSFPASGSFPVSRLFPSSGQSIGVSALTSVLSMNI